MKKIKTIIIATIFIITGFVMSAYGSTVMAKQTYPLNIWKQNENEICTTWNVVDEDTGVNYVVVTTNKGYNADCSVAITPRLNADGSLYISR